MKKAFIYLMALVTLAACDNTETPNEPQPTPPTENIIQIVVDESRLTAYQVIYSIYPEDKDTYFYCDVMSKARFESADINEIRTEFDTALRNYAQMTEATYEEVCEQMLFKGDQEDFLSNAGYRENTDFVIYAFYWKEGELQAEDVSVTEFRTPAHVDSTESVAIEFSGVDPYEMTVKCTPSADVDCYYYYFAETTKVEKMLSDLEDNNAYISYHAMNVGIKHTGEQTLTQKGLQPETSYTALVMLIDKSGNRAQISAVETTEAVEQNVRVESELFESLLGEWTGVQTISDGYAEPAVSEFTVNIVAEVEDYDYNYRDNNQLVALVDGWCGIDYYSVTDLVEYEIEDPELKWGPKWVVNGTMSDTATGLVPSTEYELLVFGAQAGAPTTGLYRHKFTTAEVVYADLDFSLTIDKYYNGTELAAIDSSYEGFEGAAIVPITANVDEAAVAFYFNAMNALDFPYYEYERIIEGLVAEGAVDDTTSYYAFEFDEAYTFFGVAEDADGNFTEVWSSKDITFKVDGCSSAEEFFADASSMGTRKASKSKYDCLSVE